MKNMERTAKIFAKIDEEGFSIRCQIIFRISENLTSSSCFSVSMHFMMREVSASTEQQGASLKENDHSIPSIDYNNVNSCTHLLVRLSNARIWALHGIVASTHPSVYEVSLNPNFRIKEIDNSIKTCEKIVGNITRHMRIPLQIVLVFKFGIRISNEQSLWVICTY
jgi:hypothetical protein